ncbi:MAG: hypothetical protein ACI81R_003148 [Bradymonadia bacterium]|jgi:hypothetical protein
MGRETTPLTYSADHLEAPVDRGDKLRRPCKTSGENTASRVRERRCAICGDARIGVLIVHVAGRIALLAL